MLDSPSWHVLDCAQETRRSVSLDGSKTQSKGMGQLPDLDYTSTGTCKNGTTGRPEKEPVSADPSAQVLRVALSTPRQINSHPDIYALVQQLSLVVNNLSWG